MQIRCEPTECRTIRQYDEKGIVIQENYYQQSLFVWADGVLPLSIQSMHELTATFILSNLPTRPEILIIGYDKLPLQWELTEHVALMKANIGVEWMDFSAACRTFNVLLSEGRQVGALLLRHA